MACVVLLALGAGGCGEEATAIRVEVTSTDLVAPRDVDTLTFDAHTLDGVRMASGTFALTEDWPHTLVIRPADDADDETIGTISGRFAVMRRPPPLPLGTARIAPVAQRGLPPARRGSSRPSNTPVKRSCEKTRRGHTSPERTFVTPRSLSGQ